MPPDDQGLLQYGLSGVQYGIGGVAGGLQYGASHAASDLARLGAMAAPIWQAPQYPAEYTHHGMTMFEMNVPQALGAATGWSDAPKNTTTVEYRQAAAEHLGQSVGRGMGFGALYGGGALVSTAAMMAVPMGRLWRGGYRYGSRELMGGATRMAGRGLGQFAWTGARAGSMAARAGMAAEAIGFSATAGTSLAAGVGGVAGAIGAVAAPMMALAAVDYAVGEVADAAQTRNEMEDYIAASSFRYAGVAGRQDSRFGGGFDRRTAGRMAEGIQNYESTQRFYDMGELKGILEKGTQIGLFTGVRDAEDFQKRFKDTAEALKNVTKILHTSLSEGLDTIKAMRDIGVAQPGAQMAMLSRSDILGLASGKTASEMFTVGLQGSQVFRGTGVSMAAGAQTNQMMFAGIENLRRTGLITSEQVAQMGGAEAFAQNLTAQGLQFSQSALGRGVLMSMAPTGQFDPAQMRATLEGRDIFSTLGTAARGMQDPLNFMKYQANQEKILGDLMQQGGGVGGQAVQFLTNLQVSQQMMKGLGIEQTRENLDTAMRFNFRRQGMDAQSTDFMMKFFQNPEELQKQMLAGAFQNVTKTATEALTERYGIVNRTALALKGLGHVLFTEPGQAIGRGISEMGADVATWYDRRVQGIGPQASLDAGDWRSRLTEIEKTSSVRDADTSSAVSRSRETANLIMGDLTETGGWFGFGKSLGDQLMEKAVFKPEDLRIRGPGAGEDLSGDFTKVADGVGGRSKWVRKSVLADKIRAADAYKVTSADLATPSKSAQDAVMQTPEKRAALDALYQAGDARSTDVIGKVVLAGEFSSDILQGSSATKLAEAEKTGDRARIDAARAEIRNSATMTSLSRAGQEQAVVASRFFKTARGGIDRDVAGADLLKGVLPMSLGALQERIGTIRREGVESRVRGAIEGSIFDWSTRVGNADLATSFLANAEGLKLTEAALGGDATALTGLQQKLNELSGGKAEAGAARQLIDNLGRQGGGDIRAAFKELSTLQGQAESLSRTMLSSTAEENLRSSITADEKLKGDKGEQALQTIRTATSRGTLTAAATTAEGLIAYKQQRKDLGELAAGTTVFSAATSGIRGAMEQNIQLMEAAQSGDRKAIMKALTGVGARLGADTEELFRGLVGTDGKIDLTRVANIAQLNQERAGEAGAAAQAGTQAAAASAGGAYAMEVAEAMKVMRDQTVQIKEALMTINVIQEKMKAQVR